MMNWFYNRFERLISNKWFDKLIGTLLFLNPVALFPQVVMVIKSQTVSGVSIPMWIIFAAIQTAMTLHGIKVKSASMFVAMLVSLIESLTIIAVVIIKS